MENDNNRFVIASLPFPTLTSTEPSSGNEQSPMMRKNIEEVYREIGWMREVMDEMNLSSEEVEIKINEYLKTVLNEWNSWYLNEILKPTDDIEFMGLHMLDDDFEIVDPPFEDVLSEFERSAYSQTTVIEEMIGSDLGKLLNSDLSLSLMSRFGLEAEIHGGNLITGLFDLISEETSNASQTQSGYPSSPNSTREDFLLGNYCIAGCLRRYETVAHRSTNDYVTGLREGAEVSKLENAILNCVEALCTPIEVTEPDQRHTHLALKPGRVNKFGQGRPLSMKRLKRKPKPSICRKRVKTLDQDISTFPLPLLLFGVSTAVSCAAMLTAPPWPGSKRSLAGIVSGSAGLTLTSLTSLPEDKEHKALRYLVYVLWAVMYLVYLRLSYLSLRNARPLYLFCSLLLAAHFALGIAGSADSISEATNGILTFGPLMITACAALVYIPFRFRAGNVIPAETSLRISNQITLTGNEAEVNLNDDTDGDLGLGIGVMHTVLGPVV